VPYTTGRIWVDPDTYDVLRFDWHSDPFEFERPRGRDKIVYQRDMTVRFKSMTFMNPDQTLLVPESTETVITFKGAKTPISRVIQSFSNYKRFTGDIQIAPAYSK
jgi:hypothetical protein